MESPVKYSSLQQSEESWGAVITPQSRPYDINLREVWTYRDLLFLFVRRDFVSYYKQTILGPFWFVIQPLLTTLMFTVVFGRLAGIPTDGIPNILFYLAGITCWNYFADCLTRTSTTFRDNKQIFGKVYFPRLIVPLSIVSAALFRFVIQFLLFLAFWIYFVLTVPNIEPNAMILLVPFITLLLATLGMGFGLVITSFTTKYRDLIFLLQFGVQLFMYATPVIYPLSIIPNQYKFLALLNPMTAIVETFKYAFTGEGTFEWIYLGYSLVFAVVLLLVGSIVFTRTEKNFMDTV